MAAILPSVPLFPNPPGIRTPVTSFNNDIISSGDWGTMNVYELYCHIINTNRNALINSECNYVIVNMKYIKKG